MESIATGVIAYLVICPIVIAALLLVAKGEQARRVVTVAGAAIIALGSIFAAVVFLPSCSSGAQYFAIGSHELAEAISYITLGVDVVLGVYIIAKGLANKKYLAPVLALAQTCLIIWFELTVVPGIEVSHALYVDNLSIIMVLVIGIIGSGICVYALGYMRDYQAHAEGKDRRPTFFALMFVFLSAMFGIVLTNNMAWMLCAWEVTTVCSFALIGFTRTQEAIDNANRQIIMNLAGGLAFAVALVWTAVLFGTLEFDQFLSSISTYAGDYSFLTVMPVLLLAFAGFTKAAQMPFQSWLLGAMVAPTPTSALLHSSTMVKAGVFLLIKLAPCLGNNLPGYAVMFVGGITFLMCALAAINMSNAKRVLAYSTISNLGLITLCAGIGSAAAIWAAIFLLVFHAAAKSLLFLCVGTAEHHVGSRDIESFDDLFERMPMLARLMAIGILGMFIAPFGMLVSKWAALQAVIVSGNVVLILLLVFGSAATFMFWAKWLGKILAIANSGNEDVEETVHNSEWASMGLMTILTVGMCIAFPLISQSVVVPYIQNAIGSVPDTLSRGDLWIMAIMALLVAIVFLSFKGSTKKRIVPVYMAGAGVDLDKRTYLDSFGAEAYASQRNWYMDELFGEKKMTLIGLAVSITLLAGGFGYALNTVQQNKDTLTAVPAASACYTANDWESLGVDKTTFIDTYLQYVNLHDEQSSTWDQYYEGMSVDEAFDYIYQQQLAYASYYSSADTSTNTSDTSEEGEE